MPSFERTASTDRFLGHIAEETSDTTRPPVGRVIKLRVGTGTHGAEKRMFFGIYNDADMSVEPVTVTVNCWVVATTTLCVLGSTTTATDFLPPPKPSSFSTLLTLQPVQEKQERTKKAM